MGISPKRRAAALLSETLRRMEPSEEIRRVVHRWMTANSEGDSESALGRMSEHPGALTIGTDLAEWTQGKQTRAI